jgi:hypothetical protein
MRGLLFMLILGLTTIPAFSQTRHRVTLTWQASPTAGVDKYGIYRGTASGGPYTLMGYTTGLSFVNGSNPNGTALVEGTTFFYVVVAFEGTLFSANSNEFKAVIPVSPKAVASLTGVIE